MIVCDFNNGYIRIAVIRERFGMNDFTGNFPCHRLCFFFFENSQKEAGNAEVQPVASVKRSDKKGSVKAPLSRSKNIAPSKRKTFR
jgi:hypothetical protein